MKLTSNNTEKENSKDWIYETLITFLSVSACRGVKKQGAAWPPQKQVTCKAAGAATGHLSAHGCSSAESRTLLAAALPQDQALDTKQLVLQLPWSPEKDPNLPSLEFHPLPAVVSLIYENFCPTALITEKPNYRGRELPFQTLMAWPLKSDFKVTL